LKALDAAFAALADPTRRGVLRVLTKGPRRAGELASALEVQASALTRHLRVLRESGFVEEEAAEDDARARIYRLRREPLSELREWIDEVETFWTRQLASFQRHAERRSRSPHSGGRE
jgi:DNA-binding transcriptional ArsR family regulator